MENSLDKDEQFLSEVFASIDEGFIIIDQGKVKYVNERASQILGHPAKEIAERSILDFAASDTDKSTIHHYLDSVLHHQADVREISFWVIRMDGARACVHCHFHYPRGDPAHYRYVILTDITDLFRAEDIIRVQKDLAVRVSATSDLAEIYKASLEVILEVGPFDSGVIFEIAGRGELRPVFKKNMAEEMVNYYTRLKMTEASMESFLAGTPVYKEHTRASDPDHPFACASVLPLRHHGTLLGVIGLISMKATTIPAESRKSLETIAAQVSSAIARARAEAALHTSEEKFRNISERMTDGVMILVDGRYAWVNPAFCKIFDYPAGDVLGQGLELVIDPAELLRVKQNNILAQGMNEATSTIETVGIRKDGRRIAIELSSTRISYEGMPAVQTIVHDITARKKAEQELRESEAKFRLISENVGDIVILLDEKMHLLFGNEKSVIEKLGYTIPELARIPIQSLVVPDDHDKGREMASHIIERRPGYSKGELRFWHKDGRALWFWVEATSYTDASGTSRGLITARDIHEKKEQELRLEGSERKYRLISENSNDLILVIDERKQVQYVNEGSLYKIIGFKARDLVEQTIEMLLHPDDYIEALDLIKDSFENLGKLNNKEVRVKSASGDYIWFDFEGLGFIDETLARRLLLVGRNIQERKEQELKLKESEERYRLLLENTSDIVCLYDKNLNILYANEQVLFKKLEYGTELFSKTRINEIVHPEDVIAYLSAINFVKTRPLSTQQREVRLKHKSGHHRWFGMEFSSSTDLHGQLRIIGIFRDIHERKLQSLKLKESEERYRLISENANDIILLLDRKMKILYCNERSMLKKLGYLVADLEATPVTRLIHPADIDAAADQVRRLLMHPGTQAKQETRVLAKGGNYIWFDVAATSYTDDKAQPRLLLVARDVQDKKDDESKIIESLERLNLITENVQDNIAIIDGSGRLEYLNKMKAHASSYTKEIIGQDARSMVYPDDAERVAEFVKESFQKGHAMTLQRAVDVPSNEIRWFETIGNTFKDKDGNLKLLTISRDISERKKIEVLLENENRLLKEIDKMRKDFVLNATHELKTPLQIIIGATDFLSKYYSDIPDAKRIDFLSSIRKGSTRLKQLIETLLDYSRLESGRLQLQQLGDADISELIQGAIQSLAYLLNRRQQEVSLAVPKGVHAMADKFRIEQVIVNLISNAVKSTPPGGKIHVELAVKGEDIVFSVRDTGVGLTREEMSRIFKKFGKIERKGLDADIDIQGTGLGLFISKEIIEMHGGRIGAESAGRNKGSTFSFSIPVRGKAGGLVKGVEDP